MYSQLPTHSAEQISSVPCNVQHAIPDGKHGIELVQQTVIVLYKCTNVSDAIAVPDVSAFST